MKGRAGRGGGAPREPRTPVVSTPIVTRGRPAAGSVCRARGGILGAKAHEARASEARASEEGAE